MNRLPRILHLEDHPMDVALVRLALESQGIDCQIEIVNSRETFLMALEGGGFDLILADRSLPSYDGLSALASAGKLAPDIPFILVSGMLDTDTTELFRRRGATECVLKSDLATLCRLVRKTLGSDLDDRERKQA